MHVATTSEDTVKTFLDPVFKSWHFDVIITGRSYKGLPVLQLKSRFVHYRLFFFFFSLPGNLSEKMISFNFKLCALEKMTILNVIYCSIFISNICNLEVPQIRNVLSYKPTSIHA